MSTLTSCRICSAPHGEPCAEGCDDAEKVLAGLADRCYRCEGVGWDPTDAGLPCRVCFGSGRRQVDGSGVILPLMI